MKHQARFSSKQEQVAQHQASQESVKEFAQSDELLRFDAAQIKAPAEIEERLQKSSSQIAPPVQRPWWKAWLGR